MTSDVTVRASGEGTFDVVVRERGGETRHTVTMDRSTFTRLAGDATASPEDLVYAVFSFLLEREPKESILGRFDVTIVSRYFPEFEREIRRYVR